MPFFRFGLLRTLAGDGVARSFFELRYGFHISVFPKVKILGRYLKKLKFPDS
jgi:hypothetical protein